MNYIITSGWWCDGTGIHAGSKRETDPNTRTIEFFDLWYKSIIKYTNPLKIFITDSNSPIKPDYQKYNDNRIEWVNLYKNFGHGVKTNSKLILPGWDRSVILGANYVYMNDVNYFVYVEQDVLLYGDNIIEYAINKLDKEHKKNNKIQMLLGHPNGTPQKLQQSLIIARKEFLPRLFYQASKPENNSSEQKYYERFKGEYTWLPFPGGRTRPFSNIKKNQYFYIQHMNTTELEYMKKII